MIAPLIRTDGTSVTRRFIGQHGLSRTALAGALLALGGCGSVNSYVPAFVKPYKIDVQQGNVVVREQVAQLKPGLTREQVRFLLGTPLLTDIFHAQRWDYFYDYRKAGVPTERRKLTVYFDEGGRVARWEGDEMPAEQPFAKKEAGRTVVEIGDKSQPAKPADTEDGKKKIPTPPSREQAQ